MALIAAMKEIAKERQTVHGSVECGYNVFTGSDCKRYLQLETFGLKKRMVPGHTSQIIQLNEASAAELKRLIEQTFPSLR